jgi:hypothetical protein
VSDPIQLSRTSRCRRRKLATKYLNQIFTITREVEGPAGAVTAPADHSELGILLITATVLGFVLPMLAILS